MPRFQVQRHEQILTKMIAKVVARTKLSDVSNTSAWKHVLAAAARQDDEQYYQMLLLRKLFDLYQAKGDDLDERALEVQPSVITRELARKSAGNIVLYRSGTAGAISWPAGIQISTADGQVFTTTAVASITPTSPAQILGHLVGQDSGLVPAIANVGGTAGNVDPDTITRFVAKPIGVDGVTNPVKFSYGLDKESDDSFLNRIIQYISTLSRGTINALEAAVLGAEDTTTGARILFAKCIEDIVLRGETTLYIDDGTGSAASTENITGENVTAGLAGPPPDTAVGGEESLKLRHKPISLPTLVVTSSVSGVLVLNTDYYCDPTSGQLYFLSPLVTGEAITADYTRYTGLIELAQKIVDGDPNDYANYPGYRSAGIRVSVTTPQVLIQVVELSIVVAEGYDRTETITTVKNAILGYINTLGISGDVLRSEIIKRVKAVAGVYDLNLVTPASNAILLDDQLARTTAANITVT